MIHLEPRSIEARSSQAEEPECDLTLGRFGRIGTVNQFSCVTSAKSPQMVPGTTFSTGSVAAGDLAPGDRRGPSTTAATSGQVIIRATNQKGLPSCSA